MSETCLIIPCYNEENRLDSKAFLAFLDQHNQYHFLFVNDGSQDDTLTVLQLMKSQKKEKISILDLKENVGKAEAVRLGIRAMVNDFEYIGYLDADLATPLEEIHQMSILIKEKGAVMVMGSRIQRLGANINRSFIRHILGRIFATVVSNMLKLPVYDTQCGAKILKSGSADEIFLNSFLSKWLFDVEVLFRLKASESGDLDIYEYPLNIWEEKGDSRIKITDVLQFPIELLRIYFKYS